MGGSEFERPPRTLDFSTKNSHFHCGSRPSLRSLLGCFLRQTFPLKGGSEFEARRVSKDYFAFKIQKYDPPLTEIRL